MSSDLRIAALWCALKHPHTRKYAGRMPFDDDFSKCARVIFMVVSAALCLGVNSAHTVSKALLYAPLLRQLSQCASLPASG